MSLFFALAGTTSKTMASAPQPLESDPQVDFYVLLGVSLFSTACFAVRSNPENRNLAAFWEPDVETFRQLARAQVSGKLFCRSTLRSGSAFPTPRFKRAHDPV